MTKHIIGIGKRVCGLQGYHNQNWECTMFPLATEAKTTAKTGNLIHLKTTVSPCINTLEHISFLVRYAKSNCAQICTRRENETNASNQHKPQHPPESEILMGRDKQRP